VKVVDGKTTKLNIKLKAVDTAKPAITAMQRRPARDTWLMAQRIRGQSLFFARQ
jgi:hypothetical protein